METPFWCRLVILYVCLRCCVASNRTELAFWPTDGLATTVATLPVATTEYSFRRSRWQRHDREDTARMAPEDYHHDAEEMQEDTKAMTRPKAEYWGGYYDFLINEGSYKFWAVFQLATAGLLIYSGFAALYYAKVNPQVSDDYDDLLLRRRRRSLSRKFRPPREQPFFGLESESLQRIIDAIAQECH